MKIKLFACLFCITTVLFAQVSNSLPSEIPSAAACPTGNEITNATNINYEQEVLELLNQLRDSKGLAPLKLAEDLTQAARYHAKDMVDNNYFSHPSKNGCNEFDRIKAFYEWQYVGENIASYYKTPADVMQAWEDSPGHYANMIKEEYREVGIGFDENGTAGRKWVQDFGRRSLVYPVVINKEAKSTGNANVDLYIYGDGIFDELRIKNEGGAWTNWQPFQKEVNWNIHPWLGTRTVHVELKHLQSGTIVSSEDQIEFNGVAGVKGQNSNLSFSITPNPMRGNATIYFMLSETDRIYISLFDISGRKITTIFEKLVPAGEKNTITLRSGNIAAGVYYLKIKGDKTYSTQKIIIR